MKNRTSNGAASTAKTSPIVPEAPNLSPKAAAFVARVARKRGVSPSEAVERMVLEHDDAETVTRKFKLRPDQVDPVAERCKELKTDCAGYVRGLIEADVGRAFEAQLAQSVEVYRGKRASDFPRCRLKLSAATTGGIRRLGAIIAREFGLKPWQGENALLAAMIVSVLQPKAR